MYVKSLVFILFINRLMFTNYCQSKYTFDYVSSSLSYQIFVCSKSVCRNIVIFNFKGALCSSSIVILQEYNQH